MQSIKVNAHVGDDGILKLELPIGITNHDLEVIIVVHAVEEQEVDENGWPKGYFEQTYGSLADDPIERGAQGISEIRDEIL